jgi:tetratricopeptide (TPR) repeat protein
MVGETKKALEIFYCYAYKDKPLLDELDTSLKPLKRQGEITSWSNREVNAGRDWVQEIDEHLDTADIILLLVSPDFAAADYIYGKELDQALARHKEGKAYVIPIILRARDYENEPFSHLSSLPSNGKPVTHWTLRDKAWLNVVEGIKNVIGKIRADDHVFLEDVPDSLVSQEEAFGQEADDIDAVGQSTINYEISSPSIERLFSPPVYVKNEKNTKKDQQEKKDPINGIGLSSSESLSRSRRQENSIIDVDDGDFILYGEHEQAGISEEASQLSLPFDVPDLLNQSKPASRARKPRADEYEDKRSKAQRFLTKNQPRKALNLLKDLDFEPISSSQRWRIAALRGHCYFGLGLFLPARKDYMYAIEEMPRTIPEDQLQEAMSAYLYLAVVERELGNIHEAAEHYHTALAQMDAGAQVRHFAEAYWGLSLVKLEQVSRTLEPHEHLSAKQKHILQEALTYAQKAKVLYESTGEMLNAVSVTCDIALIEQASGNLDQARKHLLDILHTWKPMLNISQNTAVNQKRLVHYRNVVSATFCYLADIELEAHNYDDALTYVLEGQKIAQNSNILRRAQAAMTLGKVLATKFFYYPEAENAFRQAIEILSPTELLAAQVRAHELLGHYLIKHAKVDEGKREFGIAKEISDKAQGISHF